MAEKKTVKHTKRRDFFVTYTGSDKGRAEWITHVLEEGGYSVHMQAVEYVPGENFIERMDDAGQKCKKNLLVLSPKYFATPACKAEWAEAFKEDPLGDKGKLIPVRVHSFEVKALLGERVFLDIFGLDRVKAKALVLTTAERGGNGLFYM
jgi:hypothetical protein